MNIETLEKAKTIRARIKDLEGARDDAKRKMEGTVYTLHFDSSRGSSIRLETDMLPIQLKDFIDLYISKINSEIERLETEFANL